MRVVVLVDAKCEEGVKAAVDELLQGGVELGDVEVVAEGAQPEESRACKSVMLMERVSLMG